MKLNKSVKNTGKLENLLFHLPVVLLLILTLLAWNSAKKANNIKVQSYINDITNDSTEMTNQKFESYS